LIQNTTRGKWVQLDRGLGGSGASLLWRFPVPPRETVRGWGETHQKRPNKYKNIENTQSDELAWAEQQLAADQTVPLRPRVKVSSLARGQSERFQAKPGQGPGSRARRDGEKSRDFIYFFEAAELCSLRSCSAWVWQRGRGDPARGIQRAPVAPLASDSPRSLPQTFCFLSFFFNKRPFTIL